MEFKRHKLGFFPTPLHELKRLSDYMKGPRIFVKRDDCSGLALGGNKVRKLEYILADATSQNADVIITTGAVSSNHARQTAAAASLLGLECRLVLVGHEPDLPQGNYLLDQLLGANTTCVRVEEVDTAVKDIINICNQERKKPYFIPAGGHTIHGASAYLKAYEEMDNQASFSIDTVITAVGTGTTYAGLYLGNKINGNKSSIIGISVGGEKNWCVNEILAIINPFENMLNLSPSQREDIYIRDEYVGEGYTVPYPQVRKVIELLARLEGILLDPVYTAKAMVGLLDMIEKGEFKNDQNIVFLHTGGAPEIFSMNKFLLKSTN